MEVASKFLVLLLSKNYVAIVVSTLTLLISPCLANNIDSSVCFGFPAFSVLVQFIGKVEFGPRVFLILVHGCSFLVLILSLH